MFLEHFERDRGNSIVRWGCDVIFAEDLGQVRTGSAAQIMALPRDLATSLHGRAGVSDIATTLRHHARAPARALRLRKII